QNAIDLAIANVRKFHQAQQTQALRIETAPGVVCERLSRPIDSVGLYVPAGSAPLPSAAIMLGVPALIAGCPEIVLASPPRKDGTLDPTVLAVAKRLGIGTIVKAGGAQAIAALAYGTNSVPRCCKLFGPGNSFVTAAKILVASDPDGAAIDMPAGPSELMVLADAGANPKFVAADLLSQAEHGPDSQVILITTDQATATATVEQVKVQCLTLERSDIATAALKGSRCIVVKSRAAAIEIANAYAPEHLIIQMQQARSVLPTIRNAGSVFLGPWTPESVGDYCSGTNHVLPTYGFARAYSGLGLNDFCRQMTVQELSAEGLRNIGPAAITLADAEGLGAHARAVEFRLASMTDASSKT
ncbi:MAG: histidinol dehydrogenase, partial [Pseudomonadota bacterium]